MDGRWMSLETDTSEENLKISLITISHYDSLLFAKFFSSSLEISSDVIFLSWMIDVTSRDFK